jgi:integrase
MATIRKRGNKWQAQVRRRGHPAVTQSFLFKADAEAWARQKEAEIERGDLPVDRGALRSMTLGRLLERYEAEVSPTKKGCASEGYRLRAMRARAIADTTLDKLTTARIASFRDERLGQVSPSSVRRELAIVQHCLEVARKDWGVPLPLNPMEDVRKPQSAKARTRRVTDDDAAKLAEGLQKTRSRLLADIVGFAIATGMRRGELLAMTWTNVDAKARTAYLPHTKNGESRTVPLSPDALNILSRQERTDGEDRVFPTSANAVRLAWERLKRRVGIEDLRFHDLRHEAISRFFEYGLNVPELSAISGHKDPRMLMRYTHLKAERPSPRSSETWK